MPSSWPLYIYVVFAALLGVLIPWGVRKLSQIALPSGKAEPRPVVVHPQSLGTRINVRFFLGALMSVFMLGLVFVLFPTLVHLRHAESKAGGLLTVVSILFFLLIALLYAVRKSDLAWNKTVLPVSARDGEAK